MSAKLASILARLPIPLLGLAIVVSAVQASCGGVDDQGTAADTADTDAATDAAPRADAPSEDSAEDRADGMSYGDGYSP